MMPKLAQFLIRWALVQLGIASTIGLLILISKANASMMWIWQYRPLHSESIWLGWIITFVFGMAWWILPKRIDLPNKYGHSSIALTGFIILQIDWFYRIFVDSFDAPMYIRFTPFIAVLCFVIGILPRVRRMIHQR